MKHTATANWTNEVEMNRRLANPEAAQYLGVSDSFLNKARLTGDGPIYMKLGRRVLYDVADLDAWLAARRRRSTNETDGKRPTDSRNGAT